MSLKDEFKKFIRIVPAGTTGGRSAGMRSAAARW